ncbi:protein takeout-like [Danaus plexippus]|uniref:protein takeout-like n=1 Tax=Danaus plexippus TaxID=13037 RepID=UPI002AB0020B|nr:protein takeout-like [Danaus plexippus]
MLTVTALLCFILASNGASVPSFLKICKRGDDACILSSAKSSLPILAKGIPELGVKSLDPMHIPLIVSNESGLKLKFKNSTMTGLSGCHVDDFKFDPFTQKQLLKITCDVTLSGNYEVQGQVLILPVEGKGKYKIDIRGITVKTPFNLSHVEKSGTSHWKINNNWSETFKFKVHNGTTFHFENLFNGNKVLAEPVLEMMNTNWKVIVEEISPPIIKTIIGYEVEAVNSLFGAVPAEEFFIQQK